jgi:SAM-dependent methyltransferase
MAAMPRYALLLAPSANRVYADQAARLSRAELAAFAPVLSTGLADIDEAVLGGVRYLVFTTELTPRDVAYLSNLSAAHALFELVGDLLRPVTLTPLARYDSDLVTIPKYAGKTNEQFTKLLLNLTLLASAAAPRMLDGPITVCDPLCGRGTTLNQALMYGYDAIGVEIDGKDVEAYEAFLKTYLRRKRLKHTAETVPVRREGKRVARRLEVTIAGAKDDHKAVPSPGPSDGPSDGAESATRPQRAVQRLSVLHGDSTRLTGLIRMPCADVLVADLPYGVAHGSHDESGGRSRRPLDLLERAVPQWSALLRPGGAVGLSWNLKVAGRAAAEDILRANNLQIVPYTDLAHRVDQAIERDVLVARKPASARG